MFGILKGIFAMPKAVDAIINTGDKLVFTDEERKDWVIESAKALGPQTIARRVISIIVTILWTVLTVVCAGLIIFNHDQAAAFSELYGRISMVFGGVMAFYFGTSLVRAGKK